MLRSRTDRRDARKLVELLRADLLTEVHPPSESEEALRDLCRCREDVREDLTRARHRMGEFLLRRSCFFAGTKRAWGTRPLAWLHTLHFDDAASRATFDCYLLTLDQLEERLHHLDEELAARAHERLHRRYVRLTLRGKPTQKAVVAVARELAGFLWVVLHPEGIQAQLRTHKEGV